MWSQLSDSSKIPACVVVLAIRLIILTILFRASFARAAGPGDVSDESNSKEAPRSPATQAEDWGQSDDEEVAEAAADIGVEYVVVSPIL